MLLSGPMKTAASTPLFTVKTIAVGLFALVIFTPVVFTAGPALARTTVTKPASKPASPASSNAAEAFLQARDAIRVGDVGRVQRLMPLVKGYPLEQYLDYWQVRNRLDDRSAEEVRAFLDRHEGSFLAEQLRAEWMKGLARRGQWDLFREQQPRLVNEDADLACYRLQSRWKETGDAKVLDDLAPMWAAPRELPESCMPLVEQQFASGKYGSEQAWQRFRLLADAGKIQPAKRVLDRLPKAEAPIAKTVDLAYESPAKYLQLPFKSMTARGSRELAALAFGRLGKSDPSFAAARFIDALRAGPVHDSFSAEERSYVWGQIATAAARRHMTEAVDWFSLTNDTSLADEQLAWRVRIALRARAWNHVDAAIDRMSAVARADPAWVYWKGRAAKAASMPEQSQALFTRIADDYGFYGRLAAEELGTAARLPPRAPSPTPEEMLQASAVPGLQRALALFALGMRFEGVREWNWALRGMDDRQLLAASQIAYDNEIWDRSIAAADRTVALHDFTLRYPAPHREIFAEQARARAVDEPFVLGLVRQESRFIANAKSTVGASGLMQLMPATARWVAQKLGMKNFDPNKVTAIDTNAALGTWYLRRVLDDLDGQPVLAAAAYNAGPGRARNWLGSDPMEGAVYVESIPFSETRDYVKKVLTNATYYSAVLHGKPSSLKERLGRVSPRSTVATVETP